MWPLRRVQKGNEINPDEIFLDSSNLPSLDESQFEGRVEFPISPTALVSVGTVFGLATIAFLGQAFYLQVVHGAEYAEISRENRIDRSVIFAARGVIYDRNGTPLAWNEAPSANASSTATSTQAYPLRRYTELPGLAHILGYVSYPRKDESGNWWREEYTGVSGIEHTANAVLQGTNGDVLIETDARGAKKREDMILPPRDGADQYLAIDAEVQSKLFSILSNHAIGNNFQGGAAAIMDVQTGELLALTSFPEYDNAAFSDGDAEVIRQANTDLRAPLLNRAISGVYTPGSIVKPIFAVGALSEGIIRPEKEILSTGQLVVPNPYFPDQPSVFKDWRAHGWVDMRGAIAVSSDVYFYTIGGGFEGQPGLGISRIDSYARKFGLGRLTGIDLEGEETGVIPTPEWKKEVFGEDEPWRLGDTFITSIGQFGFQITVAQAVRFAAAIANGGTLVSPRVEKRSESLLFAWDTNEEIDVLPSYLKIAREGMRDAVSSHWESRTARALDMSGIDIAAKTGTAELGERNQFMNSWVIGFWPADEPKYAFAVVLEKAPAGTLSGAAPAMRGFFEWLISEKPEYVK